MAYVKKSVTKPQGSVGRSLMTHDEFTLIDVEDIKVWPEPDADAVEITDNIVLNAGAYPISIYLTPGTGELTENSEGDADEEGFIPQFKFKHPGNSKEVRELKHNCINRRFIGLLRHCKGGIDLIGSPCNPIRMQTAYTGNSSSNSNEFTFAQAFKGDGIRIYKGTVPAPEVESLQVQNGVANVTATGKQYQMDATDVVTTLTSGKAGDVITLKGSSDSTNAAVVKAQSADVEGSNILLEGGDLTLTEGSEVTLKAFDKGEDGIVWIEQSRYTAS